MTESRSDSHKALALEYLGFANKAYHQARENRVYFARLARKHGVTIQEIADAYEVVPGTIRYWLNGTSPEDLAAEAREAHEEAPEGE